MIRDASRAIVPLAPEPQGGRLAPVHAKGDWPAYALEGFSFFLSGQAGTAEGFWRNGPGCGLRHPPGTPCPTVRMAAPGEVAGDLGTRSRSARKGALKLWAYKREAAATREAAKARQRSRVAARGHPAPTVAPD